MRGQRVGEALVGGDHLRVPLHRKGDVESVLLIKRLLYLERYSIEGAKKRIKELRKQMNESERWRLRTCAQIRIPSRNA